jgi:hypothetical protein
MIDVRELENMFRILLGSRKDELAIIKGIAYETSPPGCPDLTIVGVPVVESEYCPKNTIVIVSGETKRLLERILSERRDGAMAKQ